MGQFGNNSFELAQERIAALEKVKVHGDWQRSALQVAARAIEAHAGGPEAWDAFVKEQNENGMSFLDVFRQIIALPREQPEEVFSAVDFAKMIMTDENYIRVLECSDRGDQRFDPEFAKIKIGRREETIANLYREVKQSEEFQGYRKGKRFSQIVDPFTGDKISAQEVPWLYRGLWMTYFAQNPDLVNYAEQFDRFSNINGRNSLEGRYNEIIEAYVKGDRERYVAVVKCSDWYKNMERRMSLDRQIREASGQVDEKKSSPGKKQEIDR